ncbi:MAG: glycosyltransferase family 4 protein, partial [Candidatus Falkowbacteria bacterium]|nr:glycosyltransferase family 4 protein [Candidatus Falkowbacteria bacterium]
IKYLFRFYKYIWQKRKNYDAVFVHMNPVYVVLGGLLWKMWGKKITLWFNHVEGSWSARIAAQIVFKIFFTSPFSFFVNNKKAHQMPAGISTDVFVYNQEKRKNVNSILYLGRISPVKNINILIETAKILDKQKIDFNINIVGDPANKNDDQYLASLKIEAKELINKGRVKFFPAVPNSFAPDIFNQNEIFINLTNSGSYDKTILEAMACGNIVLLSNLSFKGVIDSRFIFQENNAKDLAAKIRYAFTIDNEIKEKNRKVMIDYVNSCHNLKILIKEIIAVYE